MDQAVYTIPEYCAAEKTSRSTLYGEWARGEGPEYFRRGAKVLISHEARMRYREKLEREARELPELAAADADDFRPRFVGGRKKGPPRWRRTAPEGENQLRCAH